MNSLLWKILLSKQGRWQFIIAAAGFCLGLIILLVSVQLYSALNKLLTEQQRKEDQSTFLIINKEVSLLNTFNKSVSEFSKEDIDTLLQQDFIISAGGFVTNSFGVSADLAAQLGFTTDLFFEAVPEKYIDKVPPEFVWEESKKFIPVIISTEFLNLYNFGYAMTQNLPQLPAGAIEMFPFEVKISGKGKSEKFHARVVGFSDRIPSVLVPSEFMQWANKNFGEADQQPSRLIIEVKDAGDERLKKFLAEKNYLANPEKMQLQKAGTILRTIVTITGAVGILFVVLSVVIFIMNFQLIISRAKNEISILLNLGYTTSSISRVMNLQLLIAIFFVIAIALTLQHFLVRWMYDFFTQAGFVLTSAPLLPLLITAGIAVGLMLLNVVVLRFSVK